MRTDTALNLLGGTVTEAAAWIGVVEEAIRRWQRTGLMAPTRDRVIAAALRKAAAEAQGITVHQWWADEITHSRRLEDVLVQHNDALVEFLRKTIATAPHEHAAGHLKNVALAPAA